MTTELVKHVKSQTDDVTKYCFRVQGQIVEFSFINKNDGKHIVVAPSQTRCAMKCRFCQLSEFGGKVQNLTKGEIVECVVTVLDHQARTPVGALLVSFMGGGEPMLNYADVVDAMAQLQLHYRDQYSIVRFAVASLAAHRPQLTHFAWWVKQYGLDCKFHLSLHAMDIKLRRHLMPAACGPYDAIDRVRRYQETTNCKVEVHYTPIEGMNDRQSDAMFLAEAALARGWPVKLLDFKPHGGLLRSWSYDKVLERFRRWLSYAGAAVEVYSPPGADIGASCGQFLPEDYAI
jgi:23S rRNA (adenine2503-C2)-methyltransferase